MRNSIVPLLAMLIVAVGATFLIHSSQPVGLGGPEINPGIFRLPKGDKGLVESLATLRADNAVAVEAGKDARVAAEPERWQIITIAADDAEPLTRATVLAMAEAFTHRNAIALILPQREAPLPLGCDRLIRVATREAKVPERIGGTCTAAIAVEVQAPRFSSGHPAAGLQGAISSRPMRLRIDHKSGDDAGLSDATWSRWYATVGRGIADAAINSMCGDAKIGEVVERAQWDSTLPIPPSHDVVRWLAAMQDELVRGWFGEIRGTTTIDKVGKEISAFEPLEELLKKGAWEETSMPGSELRSWKKEHPGATSWFGCQKSANGWDLTLWQERKEPSGVFDDWLDQAKDGNVRSRENVRRHLLSASIPIGQRREAIDVLGKNPSEAEQAMLLELAKSALK